MDTQYKIETFRSKGTTAGQFIRMEETAGIPVLLLDGWKAGPNPKYLTRDSDTIYFNSIMKVWLFI